MNPLTSYRDDGPIVKGLALIGVRRGRSVTGRSDRANWGAPAVIVAAAGVLLTVPFVGEIALLTVVLTGFIVVVGLASGAVPASRWAWLVPAAVRAVEFAGLIRIAQLYPALIEIQIVEIQMGALLVVLALHYYDIVYRLRTCGSTPASWVEVVAGGWDVRLLVVCGISMTAVLPEALVIGASTLGAVFVLEAVKFWARRLAASAR